MYNKTHIFQKIERIACECISQVTCNTLPHTDIYSGKTKTTFAISVARQLAFLFMHDNYAISYKQIAQHANFTTNAVIKNVRKAREYRFSDPVYHQVYQLIEKRL